MFEIITGTVSGVVTAALLYLLKVFITQIFLPFYAEYTYKGAIISGIWSTEETETINEEKVHTKVDIYIEQKAHRLFGKMVITTTAKNKEMTLDYRISGSYWEGFASINCQTVDADVASVAVLLLKNKASGKVLLGSIAFRNSYTDEVHSHRINLARKKND
ncbi:hypothetical protein NUF56_000724 [Yersinia enterocolitica]|nr:hypothetical protein [Yersinia enterocolitica]